MPRYLFCFSYDYDDELRRKYNQKEWIAPNPSSVFDLYELEFKRCKSKEVEKIIVDFTEDASKHLSRNLLLGVLIVHFHFDLETISQYDEDQWRHFYLNSILTCLNVYADEYGWDKDHIEKSYQKVLDMKIRFDRYWKKPVKNRETGYSAQVHVTFNDSLDMTLVVFDKAKNPIHQRLLARLGGTIGALYNSHGELIWNNNAKIRLYHSNKKDYWEYDFEKDDLNFYFDRAERGDAHGQYDLGMMYMNGSLVFVDREKALYWLGKSADQGFKRASKILKQFKANGGESW